MFAHVGPMIFCVYLTVPVVTRVFIVILTITSQIIMGICVYVWKSEHCNLRHVVHSAESSVINMNGSLLCMISIL